MPDIRPIGYPVHPYHLKKKKYFIIKVWDWGFLFVNYKCILMQRFLSESTFLRFYRQVVLVYDVKDKKMKKTVETFLPI